MGQPKPPVPVLRSRVRMRGACRPPSWTATPMASGCAVSSSVQRPPQWRRAFVTSSDTTTRPVSAASGATAGCRKPSRKARAVSRASAKAVAERTAAVSAITGIITVTLVARASRQPTVCSGRGPCRFEQPAHPRRCHRLSEHERVAADEEADPRHGAEAAAGASTRGSRHPSGHFHELLDHPGIIEGGADLVPPVNGRCAGRHGRKRPSRSVVFFADAVPTGARRR